MLNGGREEGGDGMARESRRFYVDRGSQFRFDRNLISRMKAIEADSRIRGEGRANDSMIVRVEEAPLTNYPSLLRRGRTFEGEGRGREGKIERERERDLSGYAFVDTRPVDSSGALRAPL